jgi:hypothetical protein
MRRIRRKLCQAEGRTEVIRMTREMVVGILLGGVILAQSGANARVLEVPGKYATITAACEVAACGDTIAVYPGTYHEGDLWVQAGVTVLGMGSDSTDVIVQALSQHETFIVVSGDQPVVLENVELLGAAEDWVPLVENFNRDLVIQRCFLCREYPDVVQYAGVVHSWEGNVTIRRSRIDFGSLMGGVWQWVFDPYTAGHYVLQDCVIQMSPYFYLSFGPTPAGTTYEFSNNTILGELWPTADPGGSREFSMYLVNNILGPIYCGHLPAHRPRVLEFRYNCLSDGPLDPDCGTQVGNFVADPLLCCPSGEDWRLQADSPCIGAGEHGENVGARLGICWPTGVAEGPGVGGSGLWISGPRPNPTAAGVTLLMHGARDIRGAVTVLDVVGNVVGRASVAGEGGVSRVHWDGRTLGGVPAPSGVYYLNVPQLGGEPVARRVVVLR